MHLRNKLNGLMLVLAIIPFQCREEEKKELPMVSTLTINNVTPTSAEVVSLVSDAGSETVISRGICAGTESEPTIQSTIVTVDGEGPGSYNSALSGLAPGTTYHIRAYATSSLGTSYGNELTMTTLSALPVISTSAATNIEVTSLLTGGKITSDGGAEVTARGVCWSTSHNPTIELSTKTLNGSGAGDFSSEITGLQSGTTYYLRAFATNNVGTSYGNEIEAMTAAILPVIETKAATNITANSAKSGGLMISEGSDPVTAFGVCWSTSPAPTVDLPTKTTDGSGMQNFSSQLLNLTTGVTYYVRAYATNRAGTAYGNEINFIPVGLSVTDVDGNLYRMVQIGTQIWMGENLRTTHYRDGSAIAEVTTAASFDAQTSAAFVSFNPNLSGNSRPLERLYNFYAVADPRNLCPVGTHVPTNVDWETLIAYAGGEDVAGAKLMEAGTDYWRTSIGTDDYSFTARPAHIVNSSTVELSSEPRTWAAWWTSTAVSASNAYWRAVAINSVAISGGPADEPSGVPKKWGVSVRCIKD